MRRYAFAHSLLYVVVYGVDESSQNTSRNVRLQRETDAVTKIFGNIEVY